MSSAAVLASSRQFRRRQQGIDAWKGSTGHIPTCPMDLPHRRRPAILAPMPGAKPASSGARSGPWRAPRLMIRSSEIHAAGCYTLDPIARNAIIAEYDGPRIPKSVADERYGGRPVTYLFGFGDQGDVIDGFATAMFLNHSCAPNCETEERSERIFIRALRNIAAGEELVYDYHLYDSDLSEEAPCHCGAPGCRGTMYSEAELERREALLAKAARRTKRKQASGKQTVG